MYIFYLKRKQSGVVIASFTLYISQLSKRNAGMTTFFLFIILFFRFKYSSRRCPIFRTRTHSHTQREKKKLGNSG